MNMSNVKTKFTMGEASNEEHGLTLDDIELFGSDEEFGIQEFNVAEHLDSTETMASYLTEILEAGDASLMASALGDIARAIGMGKVANRTGMGREALYKALRPEGAAPRLETVNKVLHALGMHIVIRKRPVPSTRSIGGGYGYPDVVVPTDVHMAF